MSQEGWEGAGPPRLTSRSAPRSQDRAPRPTTPNAAEHKAAGKVLEVAPQRPLMSLRSSRWGRAHPPRRRRFLPPRAVGLWGQGPQPLLPLVPPRRTPSLFLATQAKERSVVQPSVDSKRLMYTHPGGLDPPPGSSHSRPLCVQCGLGTGHPTGGTCPRALPRPRAPCQAFPPASPASPASPGGYSASTSPDLFSAW